MENKQYPVLKASSLLKNQAHNLLKYYTQNLNSQREADIEVATPRQVLRPLRTSTNSQSETSRLIQPQIEVLRRLPSTVDHCRFSQQYQAQNQKNTFTKFSKSYGDYTVAKSGVLGSSCWRGANGWDPLLVSGASLALLLVCLLNCTKSVWFPE